MEQAETYWNLITKIKPSSLHRLTKCVLLPSFLVLPCPSFPRDSLSLLQRHRFDDEIVEAFEKAFPEIATDEERLKKINEDEMKSPDGKARWRAYMAPFEKMGMGTLFFLLLRRS